MNAAPSFFLFWAEHRKHVISYTIKFIWAFPLILLLGGFLAMAIHAIFPPDEVFGFYKFRDLLAKQTWVDLYPRFLYGVLLGYVICLPIIHLSVLYLEWDKYKKDRPHSFGVYGRRTAPNGGWLLSNFERIVSGKAWEKFVDVQLHKISDSETQLRGNFTDQEIITMVKAASKRFTSFLRKPNIETDRCLEWHIHANSGEEVKLRLERCADAAHNWILTASRYDWAGRKNSPTLVEAHTTKFVVRRDSASTQ